MSKSTPEQRAAISKKSIAQLSRVSGRRAKLRCVEHLEDRRLMTGDTLARSAKISVSTWWVILNRNSTRKS